MNLEIRNKTYLISGGSKGIGKGIANILINEGAKVIITARGKKNLELFESELSSSSDRFLAVNTDVGCVNALENLKNIILEKFGSIDGIIANAGNLKKVDEPLHLKDEDYEWFNNNNFRLTQNIINKFTNEIIQSEGNIVIIGSIAGVEFINGAPLPYILNKSQLWPYAKYLSKVLGNHNVRVNLISPGNIIFKDGNWENKLNNDKVGITNYINENVPLKKFGTPEDVGNLVAFLLSNKSKFITGSNCIIDGGQTSTF